jgi:hypothetical protein
VPNGLNDNGTNAIIHIPAANKTKQQWASMRGQSLLLQQQQSHSSSNVGQLCNQCPMDSLTTAQMPLFTSLRATKLQQAGM